MVASFTENSLYNFVELDIAELSRYPEGIKDICERKIDGLIVHNFFSQEEVSKVVNQLTRREAFPDAPFGDVLIYGPALYVSDLDIHKYCDEAVQFRSHCRQLFSGGRDFESQMREVLGSMSGGRSVELPTAPDGASYTPATIRVLEEGQFMGWHFENQFLHCTSGYRHLSNLVEPKDHLSYFVMLDASDVGGELILYDLEWSETEWPDRDKSGRERTGTVGGKPIASVMENYEQMSLKPSPGDLVLFDGGRILHRVSTVESSRRRITIGGFVAFSNHREKVYYWS
jgi:hypothetical protein